MDMSEESVKITKPIVGITVITIDRQKRRNAVDAQTAKKLYDAVLAFEDDPEQKVFRRGEHARHQLTPHQVAVLNGANGTFCAGYDLHTVGKSEPNISTAPDDQSFSRERSQGPMGPSRLSVKKPLICAVSGYAVAGGLELSLLGDMRVVEEDAIFGVFCRRWDVRNAANSSAQVPLIDGGTVRLRAIVGLGRALDMILTGRPVGAQEALAMGLANRVVPKGKALDEALAIAKQLLGFPQICMNSDRESCYNACYNAKSLEDALKFEFAAGRNALKMEGAAGAQRFSSGSGRHGNFSKL
ncbi:hypothetical protein PRZ48_013019 [Zasmidium cellare]|uniref:Uncharacterized protein n=1 Tax=Zasmidium cellare TaxID=395010 RepID=A0ABR0E2V7_ZASCE|nr:hypothetical protein PRZ48_013019 [Zasmidium cellare]